MRLSINGIIGRRGRIAAALAAVALCAAAQTTEQTASIYYAYPQPEPEATAVPDGYKPVYISHYGRHGSRWITDDYRYSVFAQALDSAARAGVLTPLGLDVRERVAQIAADGIGRSGALSPIGEAQHRGIAERMALACPEVFADSAHVDAASSTSMRCAMSMAAFLERLKELNPNLQVKRSVSDREMRYIAHVTPEGKAFSADTAWWRADYLHYVGEQIRPERLMASLFTDPSLLTPHQQYELMMGLYWMASDLQDVELDLSLYDIFTYEELQAIWRTINARMYVCNGPSPMAGGVMAQCATNLLADIVDKADAALAHGAPAANLRFGHDTHLLRLLTLIELEGCTTPETDYDKMHLAWQDYALSPMAANLQLRLYRNADGDVLAKLLLNEREVTVPIDCATQPYYPWEELREFFVSKLPLQ